VANTRLFTVCSLCFVAEHLKKVHFNEEVLVKTLETAPEDVEIDEVNT